MALCPLPVEVQHVRSTIRLDRFAPVRKEPCAALLVCRSGNLRVFFSQGRGDELELALRPWGKTMATRIREGRRRLRFGNDHRRRYPSVLRR